MNRFYFYQNPTTFVLKKVVIIELHAACLNYRNPCENNGFGREARKIMDEPKEIEKNFSITTTDHDDYERVFTSSGSENNALFIIAYGIYK